MGRHFFSAIVLGAFLLLPAMVNADDIVLRYKPILVQGGMNSAVPPKVLIVDQENGNIWLWESRGASKDSLEAEIKYQGKLKPEKQNSNEIRFKKIN